MILKCTDYITSGDRTDLAKRMSGQTKNILTGTFTIAVPALQLPEKVEPY